MPTVSIVMPVYNAEKYLQQAIQSILEQVYQDFELIVIDDGSTDNSKSIILSLEDERIRFFENEANLGIVKSLNKAVALARGQYIARMDADDVCFPERILWQVDFLEKNRDMDICGGNYLFINENDEITGQRKMPVGEDKWRMAFLFTSPLAHPTVMMRSSLIQKVGGYKQGMEPAEDYELWLRMSKVGRGTNIDRFLLKYRVHNESNSRTKLHKYKNILRNILAENADYLLISDEFIDFHIRFLVGSWNEVVGDAEFRNLKLWRKKLISRNDEAKRYNPSDLRRLITIYLTGAMLSIIKNRGNSYGVRLQAMLSLHPVYAVRQIAGKILNSR